MAQQQAANYERLFQSAVPLYCPTEDHEGNLYAVSTNGEVYQVTEGQMNVKFSTGGQPTSLVFDTEGSAFIADMGYQAILSQTVTDNKVDISPVIKEFDGNPLKGPNSMILSEVNNMLFFTDSGPMGETTIDNPGGSIFAIDLSVSMLKPVLVNKLAYPCGIALSPEEKVLYVAETYKNRILKTVIHSEGVFHTSVFYQFSGRFGPTALAIDPNGNLYVARFDFTDVSEEGIITILNPSGEIENHLSING
jgi:sugar lactone lactonase YvrE